MKKFDLRVAKTYRAIMEALEVLLEKKSFSGITVNNLCEQAQVSRSTFYTYFCDKYNLLACWLEYLKPEIPKVKGDSEKCAAIVNYFDDCDRNVIKNLLTSANEETMTILHEFLSGLISDVASDDERGVAVNFSAAGVIYFFANRHKFSEDEICKKQLADMMFKSVRRI